MKKPSLSLMLNSKNIDSKNDMVTAQSKPTPIFNNYNSKILKCISQHSYYPSSNYHPNQKMQIPTQKISLSKTVKLKNFTSNHQSSQLYSKNLNHSKKFSFLINNRLTKSAFDFSGAAMIGKPQSLKTFRSTTNYPSQDAFKSLKTAVHQTNQKPIVKKNDQQSIHNLKHINSLIPQVFNKTFSLSNINQIKKQQLNASLDKSFFQTTTIKLKTQTFIESPMDKVKQPKFKMLPFAQVIKPKLLNKQKNEKNPITRLSKLSSERKIRNIDNKLSELRKHNETMIKLMPLPINKPQKVVVKGRGELISQQKITRVADKLLSVLELYFQMHQQDGSRVMDFVNNIEGFQSPKIREIFCQQNIIKHMSSNEEILEYFWLIRSIRMKERGEQIKLPQFWGEEDLTLYKVLNNFSLKLESKYENCHREKYKKMKEMKAQKQTHQFNLLKQSASQSFMNTKRLSKDSKRLENSVNPKDTTPPNWGLISHKNNHIDRKLLLSQIKYHPIISDRKMFDYFEQLQDLGVKFNFRQKGKNIILSERSKILYDKM